MMKSNIVICGFMASGKTTVGKLISEITGMEFVDTDELVERAAGSSVEAIFNSGGEEEFRLLEREVVQEIATRSGLVIALGGGAVTDEMNVKDVRATGVVYLLKVSASEALERSVEGPARPLLGKDIGDTEGLLAEREKAYKSAADVVVDTSGRAPGEIAREIAEDFSGARSRGDA